MTVWIAIRHWACKRLLGDSRRSSAVYGHLTTERQGWVGIWYLGLRILALVLRWTKNALARYVLVVTTTYTERTHSEVTD